MIDAFSTRRVKLVRQPQPLPVTDNWNRALAHARGDYVIMLGDDDALAPGSLTQLDRLIGKHGEPDVVFSTAYHYAYPHVLTDAPAGYLVTVRPKPIFADEGSEASFLDPRPSAGPGRGRCPHSAARSRRGLQSSSSIASWPDHLAVYFGDPCRRRTAFR
jgi:glycosyltransferase involved in cell wall biosynthesis